MTITFCKRYICSKLNYFCNREDGAITVDWVVLTALVVALATAAFAGIDGGVAALTASISAYLNGLVVGG